MPGAGATIFVSHRRAPQRRQGLPHAPRPRLRVDPAVPLDHLAAEAAKGSKGAELISDSIAAVSVGMVDGAPLLDLEKVKPDAFLGSNPQIGWPRLYGGQVVAQALRASGLVPWGLHRPARPGLTAPAITSRPTQNA